MRAVLLGLLVILLFPSETFAAVKVNEFLSHPDSGSNEWVEFYNLDGIDISTYWIDDDTSFTSDSGNSTKKALSTITNPTQNYSYIILTSSIFNNSGDFVVLFDGAGTIIDQHEYTSDPGENVTIGRSPDGDSWVTLSSSSQGSTNGSAVPTSTPTPFATNTPTPSPTTQPTDTPTPKPPTATPTSKPTVTPTIVPTTNTNSMDNPQDQSLAQIPESLLGENITPPDQGTVAGANTADNSSAPSDNIQSAFKWLAGGLVAIFLTSISGIALIKMNVLKSTVHEDDH